MPGYAFRILAVGLLALPAACRIDSSYDGTTYQCPDGKCPSGYTCVDGRCVIGGGAIDAGPDAEPPPDASTAPDPRLGNVLYFSFENEVAGVGVARDRGPHGLDAENNGSTITTGRYGAGRDFNDNDPDHLEIPASPRLFLRYPVTVEAWVQPHEDDEQAIFSDYDSGDQPETELSFELTEEGGLALYSNAGCADTHQAAISTEASVPLDTFTHVAATWDGVEVRFYVNAALVEAVPFAHTPCESDTVRDWRIGRFEGGSGAFDGVIDELKVSDYVKTEEQIRASMEYDPTAAGNLCGDQVIDGIEQCDGDNPCCDPDTCTFDSNGTECAGGTCQSGVCERPGGRVTDGLVALYEFDEGEGFVITDTSGVDPAVDLLITDRDDPAAEPPLDPQVTWGDSSLTIDDDAIATSMEPPDKIYSACKASREVTVETWLQPANLTQDGPARIVTLSSNSSSRNFTLGQEDDSYVFRVRSTLSGNSGTPPGHTLPGDARIALTHLVATRSASGERRMYVNGLLRSRNRVDGDLSNWNENMRFALANEVDVNAPRPWRGTFHLVAVYCRALDGFEVAQNYAASANP